MNHVLYVAALGFHIAFIKNVIYSAWPSLNSLAKGFAENGSDKALEELERLIDVGASIHDAAEGAAIGNHLNLLFLLIKRGASIEFAARGAASAGHVKLADELLIRGARLCYAAEGAGRRNLKEYLNILLDRALTKGDSEWQQVVESALMGAAYGGNIDLMMNLLHLIDVVNAALYGAASGGHYDLHRELLKLIPNENKQVILSKSCQYAAQEGNFELFTRLYIETKFMNKAAERAVYGAAAGGDLVMVNNLLNYESVKLSIAAYGAARGYQVEILNRLMLMGRVDLDLVVNEMEVSGYLELKDIFRFTSFINDHYLKNLLLDRVREINPNITEDNLYIRSSKLNELIRRNNLTFYQAQAYLELMIDGGYSCFLLQAHKFIAGMNIHFELYNKIIASFVAGLDIQIKHSDVERVYYAAHERLRDRMITHSTKGFFTLFKSPAELQMLKKQAEDRYNDRIKYLPH